MDNTRQTEKVKALVEAEERELCISIRLGDTNETENNPILRTIQRRYGCV